MRLRTIGFWRSIRDAEPSLPDPRDFIDPEWDARERARLADYLRTGRRVRAQKGKSRCRLCGAVNGSEEQTDGVYLWPEGLAHYVSEHAVRLPAEFLAHVERELDVIDAIETDGAWWAAQEAVGTARHWVRWRVDLGPCDVRATSIIQQIAGSVIGWDRAERIYTELVRRGTATFTVPDRAPAEELRERLQNAQIPCTVVEDRVPAPDTLLG
jgi:hypothetical protein